MSDIYDEIGEDINPENYDTTDNSTPVPPGEYPVLIEKAEVRNTKAGTGKYVWLQLTIIGDNYAGRKVFQNFNIKNPNPTAEQIGRRELATLAEALGIIVRDTSELIDKTVIAKLKVKDNDNEVVTYKPINGGAPVQPRQQAQQPAPAQAQQQAAPAPAQQQSAPTTATTAAPAGGKKMPWHK